MLHTALLIAPVLASRSDLEYYFQYYVCVCTYFYLKSTADLFFIREYLSGYCTSTATVRLSYLCVFGGWSWWALSEPSAEILNRNSDRAGLLR